MTAIIVNEEGKAYAGWSYADLTVAEDSKGRLYFTRLAWNTPGVSYVKVYATRQSAERALKMLQKTTGERMAVVS